MINYIRGTLRQKNNEYIVVEIGGLGFEIYTSTNSNVYLSDVGDDVTIYTQMIIREDDISLYGFSDRDELGLFKKLITVSGIGAKVAIVTLSPPPPDLFADADADAWELSSKYLGFFSIKPMNYDLMVRSIDIRRRTGAGSEWYFFGAQGVYFSEKHAGFIVG